MLSKLVILRGPSGSGKSTIAHELARRSSRPTLVISQDTFRKMCTDHELKPLALHRRLAMQAIALGLEDGYDVIFHGILNAKKYDDQFEAFKRRYETYFFYLEVSFEESVRRHQMRPKRDLFTSEKMREWWAASWPTGYTEEVIIPEESSIEESVKLIDETAELKLNK